MNTKGINHLFVYGTLMFPEILERLTGRVYTPAKAVLYDFRRLRISGKEYPAIIPWQGYRVKGELICVEDKAEWEILCFYEGDEYQVHEVKVKSGEREITAMTFVWQGEYEELLTGEWDILKFRMRYLEYYINTIIPETLSAFFGREC